MSLTIDAITFARSAGGHRLFWGLPAVDVGPSATGPDWTSATGTVNVLATALSTLANVAEVVISADLSLSKAQMVRATSQTSGFALAPSQATATAGAARVTWTMPAGLFATIAGVATFSWSWRWQRSDDGVTWHDIQLSTHEVFVGVNEPTLPWNCSGTAGTLCPPVATARLACEWAAGALSATEASDRIASGMFRLGGKTVGTIAIRYDPTTGVFGTGRGFNIYDLVDFARLRDIGVYSFNCADAANAIATLASAVGAPMSIVRMPADKSKVFQTNAYWGTGSSVSSKFATFQLHVFAVSVTSSGKAASVWEACFRLDLDGDAANLKNASRNWRRATGLPVAQYLAALAAPKASYKLNAPVVVDLDERADSTPPTPSARTVELLLRVLPGWSSDPNEMDEKATAAKLEASISASEFRSVRVIRSSGQRVTRVTGRFAESDGRTPILQYWQAPTPESALELFVQLIDGGPFPFEPLPITGPKAASVSTRDGSEVIVVSNRQVIRIIEASKARAVTLLQASTTFVLDM